MKTVVVLDTETTGMDPEEGSIVEIAAVDPWTMEWSQSLVRPDHPISFGAMAVHMITEYMVERAPSIEMTDAFAACAAADVRVAHNVEFDRGFTNLPDPWICTYRCALHLFPDAEKHSNMALAYELELDFTDAPKISKFGDESADAPHRALFDAWVTTKLLLHMIDEVVVKTGLVGTEEIIEHLIELTRTPVLLPKLRFGKHSGQPCSEIPSSYWFWVEGQDFDMDVLHTADHWLRQNGRRRG